LYYNILDLVTILTFLLAGLYNLKKSNRLKDEDEHEGFLRISGWWMLILALTVAFLKVILPLLILVGVLE